MTPPDTKAEVIEIKGITVRIVDNIGGDKDIAARIYYPDEGNRIDIVKGMSKAQVSFSIFHEIGHLIDWYMGKQSENVDIREEIADSIGGSLYLSFENRET